MIAQAKCLFVLLLAAGTLFAGSIPKGLEPVFRGVEPGKPFHAFWPPVSGADLLGTIVIAKTPGKPEALFSTIDSPDYRNPTYTKPFRVGSNKYTAPHLTQIRNLSADVAFSQLDALFGAATGTPKPEQLTGQAATTSSRQAPQTDEKPTTEAPSATPESKTTSPNGEPAKPAKEEDKDQERTVTGGDFSVFSDVSVDLTGLEVLYYDLPTLADLNAGTALTALGKDLLTRAKNGWIIHRVLTIQTITYTCTSKDSIRAALFAKLVLWIPTVKVSYKNNRTVTLTTTSPTTIGYKLWRPDIAFEGPAGMGIDLGGAAGKGIDLENALGKGIDFKNGAAKTIDLAELGLGDKEIDQLLGLQ